MGRSVDCLHLWYVGAFLGIVALVEAYRVHPELGRAFQGDNCAKCGVEVRRKMEGLAIAEDACGGIFIAPCVGESAEQRQLIVWECLKRTYQAVGVIVDGQNAGVVVWKSGVLKSIGHGVLRK